MTQHLRVRATERSEGGVSLSTHVLDATSGKPAVAVGILLESFRDGGWTEVATGLTDDDGRLKDWLPADLPGVGTHRLLFDTGAYFTRMGVASFYPAVTITFVIDDPRQHYHVPLLLSPFAYSTYRGARCPRRPTCWSATRPSSPPATRRVGSSPGAGWRSPDGLVSGVGASAEPTPEAARTIDAAGCLVTPGLVNTHHHLYQNLTRAFAPALNGTLFEWLTRLYPVWAGIDEEASYLAAWVGLAELALGGCTSTADHLYIAPRAGGDLWAAEIAAAREVGLRFHPTRGSMTVSEKDGGLPPDSVVQDDDAILADSERLVAAFHDATPASMLRVALAPCSPFSVSPALMTATAELAERLDVRLHTHLAEDPDEDEYCLERFGRRPVDQFAEVGWLTPRAWVAHCIYPDASEITRLGAAGVGRRALPELEHDPGQRPDLPGARAARGRGAGRAGLRRVVVERLGLAVAGGPHGDAARQDARRGGRDDGPGRAGDRDPRRRGVPGPHGRDRRADGRRLRRPRGLGGRPDRARRCAAPTRSRRGCAAARAERARRSWRDGFSSRTAR